MKDNNKRVYNRDIMDKVTILETEMKHIKESSKIIVENLKLVEDKITEIRLDTKGFNDLKLKVDDIDKQKIGKGSFVVTILIVILIQIVSQFAKNFI